MSTTIPPRGPIRFAVPPLENGDHLTRAEFERRSNAMPSLSKAELLEGVVYMPAATRASYHSRPHQMIAVLLGVYDANTPGTISFDAASVRLDLDNMPQPDQALLLLPECGGQSKVSDDDYLENAPELVWEISASTASYDLNVKLPIYRRNGVKEHVVWRVLDEAIDWFFLRGSEYVKQTLGTDGLLKSEIFPGLWVNPNDLIQQSMDSMLKTLDRGLASPEHQVFVRKLNYLPKG
jgi:Uma2 family endonuclease